MTVSEMDTRLSQLLNDTNGRRWTQDDHRLPALNDAQDWVVATLLGILGKESFSLLNSIQGHKQISVPTTGYAISTLGDDPGELFSEDGFIRAYVMVNGEKKRCVRLTPDKEGLQQNWYLKGCNSYPIIRFEIGNIYIDVDDGNYPVTTDIYYIRDPKELVVSSASGYQVTTCELDVGLHNVVVKASEAFCRRMADDFDQANIILSSVYEDIKIIARTPQRSVKSGIIGQWLNKQEDKRDA